MKNYKKQTGSILVIVSSIAMLISLAFVLALLQAKTNTQQLSLAINRNLVDQYNINLIDKYIHDELAMINPNELPIRKTISENTLHQSYTTNLSIINQGRKPIPHHGFSLSDTYHSTNLLIKANTYTKSVNSREIVTAFSCIKINDTTLALDRQLTHELDYDFDGETNVKFIFDENKAEVIRKQLSTVSVLTFSQSHNFSFNQVAFFLISDNETTKLGIAFSVVREVTTQNYATTFYLLFVDLNDPYETISINDLADLSLKPIISVDKKGYFLELGGDEIIESAITSFDYNLLFLTKHHPQSLKRLSNQHFFYQISFKPEQIANSVKKPILSSRSDETLSIKQTHNNMVNFQTLKQTALSLNSPACLTLYRYYQ